MESGSSEVEQLTDKASILAETYGRIQDALSYYDKALEINSEYVNALIGKGSCLSALGQSKTAILFYDKALEIALEQIDLFAQSGYRRIDPISYMNNMGRSGFSLIKSGNPSDMHNVGIGFKIG